MVKNVVVIMCDQLRKDCLGCYGNEYIKTPNIDRIAKNGVVFKRHYTANPICMPSRISIFSGMYPHNHGMWTNGLFIKDEGYMVMDRLREAGIQTANIGKIHFEPHECPADFGSMESDVLWSEKLDEMDKFHGPYWGYDYVEIQDSASDRSQHMIKWFYKNGGTDEMYKLVKKDGYIEGGATKVPNYLHRSTFVGERSVNYIENIRDKERPFFLTVSFSDPHHPFIATEKDMDKWGDREFKKPVGSGGDLESRPQHYRDHLAGTWSRRGTQKGGTVSEQLKDERIKSTYAMIELVDENVGKVLDALERENLLNETAVIFTSDHGELLGDFGLWAKGPFYFEGLISTPLIISYPNCKARKTESLSSSVDMAPTVLELLGLKKPYYMDGVSLREVLNDVSASVRDWCLTEYRNGFNEKDCSSKAVITDEYKYVRYQTGESELTDLKNDPDELVNRAGDIQYAETEQKLKEKMLDVLLSTESKKPYQHYAY